MDLPSSQAPGYTTLPSRRCGIQNCRTHRYRRDPTDGHLYCRYGHQQPDALETQIEDTELLASQSIKTTKRKKNASRDALEGADEAAPW
ncbi:MAG: hypothetical protein Q9159_006336, partial [Coniocarpon cinnabarinum]